jgi:hypothetical protein
LNLKPPTLIEGSNVHRPPGGMARLQNEIWSVDMKVAAMSDPVILMKKKK